MTVVVAINVFSDPTLFDSYTLGDVRAPGVVTFSGHDSTEEWDVKKAKGNNGATVTRGGRAPVEFTASHSLVTDPLLGGIDDQQGDWDEFAKLINSTTAGDTPKALDIYHPDLARNNIKSVVKKSIGGFKYDGKGGATVEVRYLEYSPATATPAKGAKGSGTGGGLGGVAKTTADAFANIFDQAKSIF